MRSNVLGHRFLRISALALALSGAHGAIAYDGDPTQAIFVDGASGSDGNAGTIDSPKQTIMAGIATASANNKRVVVSAGTYAESVQMAGGVSVYGKYNRAANWTRDDSNVTTIAGATGGINTAVSFDGVSGETHLEGFVVSAPDAAASGDSSYAVRVVGSTGPIYVRYNTLMAGHGGAGTAGAAAVTGAASGGKGTDGKPGDIDNNIGPTQGGPGGISTCGNGGNGGAGMYGKNSGLPGTASSDGAAPGGGGSSGNPGQSGGKGTDGTTGTNGTNGLTATQVGTEAGGLYALPSVSVPGQSTRGSGGGGGGGGGGQDGPFTVDGTGSGGGGGGGGGCAGASGHSGTHGGGSFGVFVSASMVTLDANRIIVSSGGAGGNGSTGAPGGTGGPGGAGGAADTSEIGKGGAGGNGGKGGNGGTGAGGNGGPSIGVFGSGDPAVTLGTLRFTLPTAAAGGTSSVNAGTSGLVANGYPGSVSNAAPATLATMSNMSVLAGISGATRIAVPIVISPITDQPINVNYQTADGTAIAGQNYVAASGTVTIPAWQSRGYVPITILGTPSADRTFSVSVTTSDATVTQGTTNILVDYDADVIFIDPFE